MNNSQKLSYVEITDAMAERARNAICGPGNEFDCIDLDDVRAGLKAALGDVPQFKITDEMLDAGARGLHAWYSTPYSVEHGERSWAANGKFYRLQAKVILEAALSDVPAVPLQTDVAVKPPSLQCPSCGELAPAFWWRSNRRDGLHRCSACERLVTPIRPFNFQPSSEPVAQKESCCDRTDAHRHCGEPGCEIIDGPESGHAHGLSSTFIPLPSAEER